MKLFLATTAGALLVVACILALGVTIGLAAECQWLTASWYGAESCSRNPCRTANGERFDGSELTAASRMLPFDARLRVTYRGKSVVVRINDRGPFVKGRSLDLSRAAAQHIGLIPAGVGRVCVVRLN